MIIHAQNTKKSHIVHEDNNPTFFMGLIQTMLDDIDFSRANQAFLTRETDGSRRLLYKDQPWPLLSAPRWASLIDESAIKYDKWRRSGAYRSGWWNSIKVDVTVSLWDDPRHHDMETEGHRIMQYVGLNELTFEMLGHLVRDGEVVGHMRKAIEGRLVEYHDRAAVFEAVARIQAKGILFKATTPYDIYMTDGGVRFTSMSSIEYYEDRAKLEEKAEYWHWCCLQDVFDGLKYKEYNDAMQVFDPTYPSDDIIIPGLPSPGRSLPSSPDMSHLIQDYSAFLKKFRKQLIQMSEIDFSTNSTTWPRPRKRLMIAADDNDDCFQEARILGTITKETDQAIVPRSAHTRRIHVHLLVTSRSYHKSGRSRARKRLIMDASRTSAGRAFTSPFSNMY